MSTELKERFSRKQWKGCCGRAARSARSPRPTREHEKEEGSSRLLNEGREAATKGKATEGRAAPGEENGGAGAKKKGDAGQEGARKAEGQEGIADRAVPGPALASGRAQTSRAARPAGRRTSSPATHTIPREGHGQALHLVLARDEVAQRPRRGIRRCATAARPQAAPGAPGEDVAGDAGSRRRRPEGHREMVLALLARAMSGAASAAERTLEELQRVTSALPASGLRGTAGAGRRRRQRPMARTSRERREYSQCRQHLTHGWRRRGRPRREGGRRSAEQCPEVLDEAAVPRRVE